MSINGSINRYSSDYNAFIIKNQNGGEGLVSTKDIAKHIKTLAKHKNADAKAILGKGLFKEWRLRRAITRGEANIVKIETLLSNSHLDLDTREIKTASGGDFVSSKLSTKGGKSGVNPNEFAATEEEENLIADLDNPIWNDPKDNSLLQDPFLHDPAGNNEELTVDPTSTQNSNTSDGVEEQNYDQQNYYQQDFTNTGFGEEPQFGEAPTFDPAFVSPPAPEEQNYDQQDYYRQDDADFNVEPQFGGAPTFDPASITPEEKPPAEPKQEKQPPVEAEKGKVTAEENLVAILSQKFSNGGVSNVDNNRNSVSQAELDALKNSSSGGSSFRDKINLFNTFNNRSNPS